MGTYSSIKARVVTRVIDLPSAVLAEVPILINEAIRDLQSQHNFKVMEGELSFVTTIGQRVLGAVPYTTFKEYRGEPWFVRFTDGSIRYLTSPGAREAIWGLIDQDDVGFPQLILDGIPNDTNQRNFEVYPLPDGLSDYADGEYRVTIPYYRTIPDLVADGDSNWFTVNAERFIVEWATAKAFALDWDEQHSAVKMQEAELERRIVVKKDKTYRLAGVNEFVPHWRGVHANRTRI